MAKVDHQKSRDEITRAQLKAVRNEYNIDPNKSQRPDDEPGDFSKKILRARDVTLIGGPFHYNIRSATYGDPYDEIPWKVRMGMADAKERHGYEANPFVCNYGTKVLQSNWVEERRDRKFIKYDGPKLSQYGHHYLSEMKRAYQKPNCNKQRDVLLKIKSFPLTSHPGHQPELNTDTLCYSAPTPASCIEDEQVANCLEVMKQQKRAYKATI